MRWLLIMGAALVAFASDAMGQGTLPAGDYRVAEIRALGELEVGSVNVRDGRFMARAVSDLMLRLDERSSPPSRGGFDVAAARERPLQMRLFLVMAGRIAEVGHARCVPGQGAVVACALDCDGGTIGLSFPSGGGGSGRPALLLGSPGGNGDEGGTGLAGIRLGACQGQQALVLRPRRAEVRLPLEPMRAGVGTEQAPVAALPSWGANEATGSIAGRVFSSVPGSGLRQRSPSERN